MTPAPAMLPVAPPSAEINRPITILVHNDHGLTSALWRAFAGHPSVEAIYIATSANGVQRLDVWKRKLVILDCFSGAGGCSVGYSQASFDVVGIDINPMPRYPFPFVRMDALEALRILIAGGYITDNAGKRWYLSDFAAIHASPPCQFGSQLTPMAHKSKHKNLIPEVRTLLNATKKPYVIENVKNVRRHLINPVLLCGSMFGLNIWRHRYFELWPDSLFMLVPKCNHSVLPVLISGTMKRKGQHRREHSAAEKRSAIEINWMTVAEMDNAIPPIFTRWIGQRLMEALQVSL